MLVRHGNFFGFGSFNNLTKKSTDRIFRTNCLISLLRTGSEDIPENTKKHFRTTTMISAHRPPKKVEQVETFIRTALLHLKLLLAQ